MGEAENQINDLEHKGPKNNQLEQQEEKKNKKTKYSVSSFWDNFKGSKICIIEVPEGEEKEQEMRNLFEIIMKENLPNLMKEIDIQVQSTENTK